MKKRIISALLIAALALALAACGSTAPATSGNTEPADSGNTASSETITFKLAMVDNEQSNYDVNPNYEVAKEYNVTFVGFEELMKRSDIICILVPLVPSTENMINRESLALTKPGVVIVTDARGEVVDEAAMYDALVSGHVAYFASDVFVNEPATPENTPLLTLPNVIATSHNGAESYENLENCGILTASQIIDALEGREPQHRQV